MLLKISERLLHAMGHLGDAAESEVPKCCKELIEDRRRLGLL